MGSAAPAGPAATRGLEGHGAGQPRLSICVPTRNRRSLLADLLAGLLGAPAAARDVEIVVSDNASTDGTQQLCEDIARTAPGLRYFRQAADIGLLPNYVAALRRARGRYCVPLCDDDRIDLPALMDVAARLDADPRLVAWYAPFAIEGADGAPQGPLFTFPFDEGVFGRDRELELFALVTDRRVVPEIGVFRASALRAALMPGPRRYWAWDLMFGLLRLGAVALANRAFYVAVAHRGGHASDPGPGHPHYYDDWRSSLEAIAARAVARQAGTDAFRAQLASHMSLMIDRFMSREYLSSARGTMNIGDALAAHDFLQRAALWSRDSFFLRDFVRENAPLFWAQAFAAMRQGMPELRQVRLLLDGWPDAGPGSVIRALFDARAGADPAYATAIGREQRQAALADPGIVLLVATIEPAERDAARAHVFSLDDLRAIADVPWQDPAT
ncbi:MAG: glycosyltransferase family 2 protein [Alphaproteobacteria bacterium]|nr:glycosyltransferase family 2 protein [Alphaproteobacteria bacterium]